MFFCQSQPTMEIAPRMSTTTTRRGAPRRGEPSARNRLIETATELFYQEGIRAIGIDTVVARSGVSKSSLYRTFASKKELIAAFAEEQIGGSGNGGMRPQRATRARRASRSKRCLRASPGRSQIRSFAAALSSISPLNFQIGSTPAQQLPRLTKRKCVNACAFSLALSGRALLVDLAISSRF